METNAAAASFTWTSVLIQDPNNPQNTRVVLKRVRTERLQDAQYNWTCTVVDDQNPRAILRRVPVKDASPGEAPTQPQVTTRKRVTIAKKKQGTGSGWFKSMQSFLRQKHSSQNTGNNTRPEGICPGRGDCEGDCGQGVACRGKRPLARHHLLIDEDYISSRRTCIVIDVPTNRRMIRRKRPSRIARFATKRPGPGQR